MTVNAPAPDSTRPTRSIARINRGRGHSYKIDGRRADGVTTLLGKGVPKPALMYWSARTVAEYVADAAPETLDALRTLGRDGMVKALKEIPWSARDAAAVRGTELHQAAERIVHGQPVEVPDELEMHARNAARFMDEWRIAPVLSETVVASRTYNYAGTLDLVADLPDGRRAIIDYKTGERPYGEVALQLAAYRHAQVYQAPDGSELPMTEVGIDCGYVVTVRADGYDAYPVACDREAFGYFLAAAALARAADRLPALIGEAEHWTDLR